MFLNKHGEKISSIMNQQNVPKNYTLAKVELCIDEDGNCPSNVNIMFLENEM